MTDSRPTTEADARAYVLRHADDIYVRHAGESLALTELPPDVAIVHVERFVRGMISPARWSESFVR